MTRFADPVIARFFLELTLTTRDYYTGYLKDADKHFLVVIKYDLWLVLFLIEAPPRQPHLNSFLIREFSSDAAATLHSPLSTKPFAR
jgi:hypothetical protein